jgi:hypothetical protein
MEPQPQTRRLARQLATVEERDVAIAEWRDETARRLTSVDEPTEIASLFAAIDALRLLVERTNADINANPAAAIKDVAREAMTIARQTIRFARLLTGQDPEVTP